MSAQAKGRPMSSFVYGVMWLTAVLAGAYQLHLDAHYDNMLPVFCVLLSTSVCLAYLQRSDCMKDAAVSSFAILGFLVTTLLGALWSKSLEGLPISSDLKTPVMTFTVLSGALLCTIALHWAYRHLLSIVNWRNALASRWLAPAGLYDAPPPGQMWLMSFFGLYAVLINRGVEFGDVGGKFIAGFTYLAWLPFLVPIFKARGDKAYQNLGLYWVYLSMYAGLLALVGVALNARVIIFSGAMVIMLLALFETMRGRFQVGRWTWLKAIVALSVVGVGVVVGDDLATAMVIVRQKTESLSPKQKVLETYDTFVDPNLIPIYKDSKEAERLALSYDEIYIHNAILARFTETKFHDNVLNCAMAWREEDRADLWQATVDKLYAILPTPVMKALKPKLDKDKLAYSFGDYLCNVKSGVELGGYRTGSLFAHAYALLAEFSGLVLAILFLFKFFMLDLYSVKQRTGVYLISPVLMLTVWFNFISSYSGDSLVQYIDSLTRVVWQQIALYLLLTFALRSFMNVWRAEPVLEIGPVRRSPPVWREQAGRIWKAVPRPRWRRA